MIGRVIFASSVFLVMSAPGYAATKISLVFTNSGDGANVVIVDEICKADAFNGYFSGSGLEALDNAFCVEDAAVLKANLTIAIEGTIAHELEGVVAGSTVDISTGTITEP